ncbi:MAG: TrkA family potassium uptake protein [Caldisericota bacterium]|jgi:trk system potassium uptake protein TrkA|nr:TrkA family potassium uptake protein [Caldisericota bacterium]
MYIVIVGCGRLGSKLATQLSEAGHDVAIVDRTADNFSRLSDDFNGVTVAGVGFDEEVLKSAGIEHADGFAAVSESDNENIMAAQVAKNIFSVPTVLARVFDPVKGETYAALGLETVCPTTSAANIMFSRFIMGSRQAPFVLPGTSINLVEVFVPSALASKSLRELETLGEFRVVSLTRDAVSSLPRADDALQEGDRLLVAVHVDGLPRLLDVFHVKGV